MNESIWRAWSYGYAFMSLLEAQCVGVTGLGHMMLCRCNLWWLRTALMSDFQHFLALWYLGQSVSELCFNSAILTRI